MQDGLRVLEQERSTEARPQPAHVKRPVGVTVIAVLNIIAGALLGLMLLALGRELPGGLVILWLGLSAASLVVAVGLLSLSSWARITACIFYSVNILIGVFELFAGDPSGLFAAAFGAWAVYYLTREHVREAFAQAREAM